MHMYWLQLQHLNHWLCFSIVTPLFLVLCFLVVLGLNIDLCELLLLDEDIVLLLCATIDDYLNVVEA